MDQTEQTQQQPSLVQTNDNTPITIQVVESQMKDKVVSYLIKGEDKNGAFEAIRRFNDFYNLRQALVIRWPGCYVPPIPSKQTLGNTETKVVEDRKRFLSYFCEQMATLKYLFYSDEFQTFLRTKNADMEKTLNSLPKQTFLELINKYKNNFQFLEGKEINTDMSFKITAFATYLSKSLKNLETLKNQVKILGQVKKQYTDQYSTIEKYNILIANMTQVLIPEYEKNILLEYADQKPEALIFTNNNEVNVIARDIVNICQCKIKKRDKTQNTNNFDLISDMVRIECKEVESFQETLAQKDIYDKQKQALQTKLKDYQSELSQLLAGKTTLKSFFSKGSNSDQVQKTEKNIQDTQAEIDNVTQLCDVITILLGQDEIDRFKKKKALKYLDLLQNVAQLEIDLNCLYIKLWTEVDKNTQLVVEGV